MGLECQDRRGRLAYEKDPCLDFWLMTNLAVGGLSFIPTSTCWPENFGDYKTSNLRPGEKTSQA